MHPSIRKHLRRERQPPQNTRRGTSFLGLLLLEVWDKQEDGYRRSSISATTPGSRTSRLSVSTTSEPAEPADSKESSTYLVPPMHRVHWGTCKVGSRICFKCG
ncbi:hypothetical protein SLA2020_265330 [Shorea laevis]